MIIVPLKWIEYGFGYIIIRSPNTPYCICLITGISSQSSARHVRAVVLHVVGVGEAGVRIGGDLG